MGAFFITNNTANEELEKARLLFSKKNMKKHHTLSAGNFSVIYFEKSLVNTKSHIHKQGKDFIIGIGVFLYKENFASKALQFIYNDYSAKGISIFNEIFGHFNFIIYSNEELKIITDKTGSFHSFYGHNKKKETFFYSTSMLAIKKLLPKLTFSKQECLEFIASDATYGGKTFCKEISYLPFGSIITLKKESSFTSHQYFKEKKVEKNFSVENIIKNNNIYFRCLKNLEVDIIANLTAGLDSRLVCAFLKNNNIHYSANTTMNQFYSSEAKLVSKIAKKEGIKLSFTETDSGLTVDSIEQFFTDNFFGTELGRDLFYAISTHSCHTQSAQMAPIVLGGYGGELYRDVKYRSRKARNYGELYTFKRHLTGVYGYNSIQTLIGKDGEEEYFENLKKKFLSQSLITITDKMSDMEKIERDYYISRMMYWGGAEITRFNQHCYRLHPLIDYNLIYPLFFTGDSLKKNSKLQMQTIEKLDKALAQHPSDYGYNFIWKGDFWVKLMKKKNDLQKLFTLCSHKLLKKKNIHNDFYELINYFMNNQQFRNIHMLPFIQDININSLQDRTLGNIYSLNYFFNNDLKDVQDVHSENKS